MTRSRDLANLADGVEFLAADHTKLDGIEASATADQTDAEIRTAVEAASDSNVFTDADHSKLNAIEASATADQTNAEIRAAVEAATDSNVFTDADHSKLNAVEASADVTDTTNVTAAGALMDSELTNLAAVKAINQSLVTTATPTFAGLATTADVTFGDNDKAVFGAGSDLRIYHVGSNSYIEDVGDGDFYIDTNGTHIALISDGSFANGKMAVFTKDGAVTLYHNNYQKLATAADGISVTGDVAITSGGTLDVFNSGNTSTELTALFGADNGGGHGRTNSTVKSTVLGVPHYTNSEEAVALIVAGSTSSSNFVTIGGGASVCNAATEVNIRTAANQTTTGGTERLKIQSDAGNNVVVADGLTLTNGNLKVAAGHGINFSAYGAGTNVNNNLLNDYEEGTWTVGWGGATVSGYTTAYYTKIGNYVYFNFYTGVANISSSSGSLHITGLPFTSRNIASSYSIFHTQHQTFFNDVDVDGGYIAIGDTRAYFLKRNTTSGIQAPNGNGKYAMVSGMYQTDS